MISDIVSERQNAGQLKRGGICTFKNIVSVVCNQCMSNIVDKVLTKWCKTKKYHTAWFPMLNFLGWAWDQIFSKFKGGQNSLVLWDNIFRILRFKFFFKFFLITWIVKQSSVYILIVCFVFLSSISVDVDKTWFLIFWIIMICCKFVFVHCKK